MSPKTFSPPIEQSFLQQQQQQQRTQEPQQQQQQHQQQGAVGGVGAWAVIKRGGGKGGSKTPRARQWR